MTGVFVIAMPVVGAEFLNGTGRTIDGEEGLVPLADALGDRLGEAARWLFLLGFFSAAFSSLVGAWNGFAYLFADFVRTARAKGEASEDATPLEETTPFRWLLVWISFPPMVLLSSTSPSSWSSSTRPSAPSSCPPWRAR